MLLGFVFFLGGGLLWVELVVEGFLSFITTQTSKHKNILYSQLT